MRGFRASSAPGNLDRSYPLPAGTWILVLERAPAGAFTLQFE
jgi:hypothetical protein